MKRMRFLLSLAILHIGVVAALGSQLSEANVMEEVWKEFRQIHPYGYQTVALKHIGSDCVFVISEPSESVTEEMLSQLFLRYGGSMIIKHQPLGYDGWLGDAVGIIHSPDDYKFNDFTRDLFNLLYGTDYKAFYSNLDEPLEHCYYSHHKLNYSISAEELSTWIVKEKERFVSVDNVDDGLLMSELLNDKGKTGIYYSKNPGFVVWLFNTKNYGTGNSDFRKMSRRFSLDSDLILGAFGTKGKRMAIVGRERQVPVDVLPPLRSETIELIANSDNESLAQSYERHNVFGGKTSQYQDVAPIYLSDELWHTEYGNLLNVTDQMLKSWSENGDIKYIKFGFYPQPIDWAFIRGAVRDLHTDGLTYNWNTAGAGYVIPGDGGTEILSVNRTGSLPVSYIPSGMEGKAPEEVVEAEELAYDFFSGLNNPDLTRVVQYATLYQIFQYFKAEKEISSSVVKQVDNDLGWIGENGSVLSYMPDYNKLLQNALRDHGITKPSLTMQNDINLMSSPTSIVPNYSKAEQVVERLLKLAENPKSKEFQECYDEALNRYYAKVNRINNVQACFKNLLENDPFGGFIDFLKREKGNDYIDHLKNYKVTFEDAKEDFDYYLRQSLDTVSMFITTYKKKYGKTDFPFQKASHMVVCSSHALEELNKRNDELYNNPVLQVLIMREEELDRRRKALNKRIDTHNANRIPFDTDITLDADIKNYRHDESSLNNAFKRFKQNRDADEKILLEDYELYQIAGYSQSIGTLNWLLTDPQPYNEPIGDFFAQHLTTHATWTKSPSIVSSKGSSGYGGHNLDAKVTRVKVDPAMRRGQSRVAVEHGKRVVYVATADRGRVTTSTLREIERKAITGNYTLPQAPVVRSREALLGQSSIYSESVRGFRVESQANVASKEKKIFLGDIQKSSTSDAMKEAVSQLLSDGKTGKLRFELYSEQEVRVIAENLQECIMERSLDMQVSLENFDINGIRVEHSATDPTVLFINIPQKIDVPKFDNYRSAGLELQMPSKVSEQKAIDAVKSLFDLPSEKIDNRTKWMHELKRNLEKNTPELHFEDVHDDYYINYSFIFKFYKDDIIFCHAA